MTDVAAPFGPSYGFGAYIHWPYCSRICPYCDFNVYAAKQRDNAPLLDAITRDIDRHGAWLTDHPPLTSIYLGGGTPSLLSGGEIEQLIGACDTAFGITGRAEITLEANPQMVTPDVAADWYAAGVTRISLGVQSLTDDALVFLGRDHNADDALRAAEIALKVFPSVSLDLIYARPGQTAASWTKELQAATAIGAHHISLYELTIEPDTAFGRALNRGALIPMPDDAQADLFELTHDLMAEAGYPAYEISNFACAEAHRSAHNLTYWRSGDWIGVGPGAHGRVTIDRQRVATEAERKPLDYIKAMPTDRREPDHSTILSNSAAAEEMLAMGLRTIEGIAPKRLDQAMSNLIDQDRLMELKDDGWILDRQDRLILSQSGRLLADKVVAELVA
ncbi:MAG: radical SAM family heme chaperone HemW [Pseudomonadota bacterium]